MSSAGSQPIQLLLTRLFWVAIGNGRTGCVWRERVPELAPAEYGHRAVSLLVASSTHTSGRLGTSLSTIDGDHGLANQAASSAGSLRAALDHSLDEAPGRSIGD